MQLSRLPEWERRLADLINRNRATPYRYGTFDCAVFARMAVEAVTGVELMPGVEVPKGWLGVAKFMIARGWDDVEAMATELLGGPCEPHLSRRGDIVSFLESGETHLAVRAGSGALTPAASGLVLIDVVRWRNAWRVG